MDSQQKQSLFINKELRNFYQEAKKRRSKLYKSKEGLHIGHTDEKLHLAGEFLCIGEGGQCQERNVEEEHFTCNEIEQSRVQAPTSDEIKKEIIKIKDNG